MHVTSDNCLVRAIALEEPGREAGKPRSGLPRVSRCPAVARLCDEPRLTLRALGFVAIVWHINFILDSCLYSMQIIF